MNNYAKVLLATDFSKPAESLTDCLFTLCPDLDTEIIVAHVAEDDADPHSSSYKETEEKLAEIQEILKKAGYESISIMLMPGDPFLTIHNLAEENEVDLVLTASHGKGFLESTFMGSTTFDLARKATYPLFIEKIYEEEGKDTPLLEHVLLPTDFSKESLVSLNFVRNLHEHIGRVTIVYVIEKSRNSKDLEQKIEQSEVKLKELVEEVKIFGIKADYILEKGSASKKLRHIAEDIDASIIIMAKTGGGLIKGLPLGSTSQNVALNSDRPLLLLPADEDDE